MLHSNNNNNDCSNIAAMIGKRIQVRWDMSDGTPEWFDGTIQSCSGDGSEAVLRYDDGDSYLFDIDEKIEWRFRPMAPNSTETAAAAAVAVASTTVTATEDRIQSATSRSYKIEKVTEKREATNESLAIPASGGSLDSSTSALLRKATTSASSNESVSKKKKKMDKETKHRQLSPPSLPSSLTTTVASKVLKKDQAIETNNHCLVTKKRKATPDPMISKQASPMTKKSWQHKLLSSELSSEQHEQLVSLVLSNAGISKKSEQEKRQSNRSTPDTMISHETIAVMKTMMMQQQYLPFMLSNAELSKANAQLKGEQLASLLTSAASKLSKEDHSTTSSTIEPNDHLVAKQTKPKKQQLNRSTPDTMILCPTSPMAKKMRRQQRQQQQSLPSLLSDAELSRAKTQELEAAAEQPVLGVLQKKPLLPNAGERTLIETRRKHYLCVAKRRCLPRPIKMPPRTENDSSKTFPGPDIEVEEEICI